MISVVPSSGGVLDEREIVFLRDLNHFQVKHGHPEVQKAGLRCLGLFGQLATRPSSSVVRQLRLSISSGIALVQNMAIKALFDLVLCHGATSLDRAIGIGSDMGPVPEPHAPDFQVLQIYAHWKIICPPPRSSSSLYVLDIILLFINWICVLFSYHQIAHTLGLKEKN